MPRLLSSRLAGADEPTKEIRSHIPMRALTRKDARSGGRKWSARHATLNNSVLYVRTQAREAEKSAEKISERLVALFKPRQRGNIPQISPNTASLTTAFPKAVPAFLSMTKIQKYSGLDDFPANIVFDKIKGTVYYFCCVYRGLSGCVSRLEESNSKPSSIHRNIVLLTLASHLSQRLSIGAEL